MEILVMRDLVKDEYGNYYIASKINDNEVTLVNAIVYYSFNRILKHDFVDEVYKQYSESVGVGQYFVDLVKTRIEGLSTGKYPGGIYSLEDVSKEYTVKFDGLHERSVNIKVKMKE